MRTFGPRLAALSATMLVLCGLSVGSAHGDRLIETVYGDYYVPTGYASNSRVVATGGVYYSPSSYAYVTPSSYSFPPTTTTYLAPANYATTAYSYVPTSYSALPMAYSTTYYRRPGLLRRLASRPVIETTYRYGYDAYPTTTYLPTSIQYEPSGLMATTYGCQETAAPFNPPQPPADEATPTGKVIRSRQKDTADEPAYDDAAAQKGSLDATKDKPKLKAADPANSPLDAPAPDKDGTGAGQLNEPDNALPKAPQDSVQRTDFRKTMKEIQPRMGPATTAQSVLRGEVISGASREPKANLQVVFTDLKNRFADFTRTTDAKGTFEVYLPDGSWSYRVVDPSAAVGTKPKEYDGQVIATSGRYLDEAGSPLYGLRLNY